MEDVLDLYHADYDPDHPVVCFDETSRQLVADKRPVIGAKPGRVERYDYEYKRNGTRNLFMFCEPKAGWRHVEVTERRTAVDFAHQMRWLVDDAYPHTETIRLVLDNLNTHKLGSLYDAFKPAEARRIAKRLEFHYTPLHGSWLNMAEIELSVFSNQCLNRRISDEVILKREVSALERKRNEAVAVIDWRFSTQDARTKLQHIYPSYSDRNGTRFLDVTKNPMVALFHACEQNEDYDREDARLHVFAVPRTMVKSFNSDTASVVANFAKLSRDEQSLLLGKEMGYQDRGHRRTNYYAKAMDRLCQLIQEEKPYFQNRIDIRDLFRVVIVEPQERSERLRVQSGAFLVSGFHERFERHEIESMIPNVPVYAHYTLSIPHDCKPGIVEDLQLINVKRETLYPGLDESAKAITQSHEQ